jgi:hypothetical protein
MSEQKTQPPIPVQPPPSGLLPRLVLLLVAAVGVTLCVARPAFGPVPADLVLLFGATLCVYATVVALAWFPQPWISRRFEQTFEHVIDEQHSGWYLMVVLAHFARAEVTTLLARPAGEFSLRSTLLGWLKDYFLSFSVDSFMNALWASLWPMREFTKHGLWPTAIFALAVYGLYALGSRLFGEARLTSKAAPEAPPVAD